jgi:multidrug efflux pump subunit AcrA (membrane-fusion protein)
MIQIIFKSLAIFILALMFSCSKSEDKSLLYTTSIGTYKNDIVIEGSVEALRSTTIACPARIDGTVVYIVEDGTMVKKGDTVCILENRELENFYENLTARVEQFETQYTKGIANLNMDYALLQAQVESNKAQLSITRLDTAQLEFLSEQQRRITNLELEKAMLEKKKLERKLEFLEVINESELRKLELQIAQQKNQSQSILDLLNQLIMTAPLDGLALRATHRRGNEKVKEGDMVWQALPLVEIPDLTEVTVTFMASENDYKRISVSDSVVYTFDAMPGNMAWGKILRKSPVGDPISRDSKVRFFEITASVDSFKTIPEVGISANCRIILQNIPHMLVIPQLAIFDNDTNRYVFVKKGNTYEKREILTGESSPKEAVILAGLKANETLTFIQPQESRIRSIAYLPDSIKQNLRQKNLIPDEDQETVETNQNSLDFDYNGYNENIHN